MIHSTKKETPLFENFTIDLKTFVLNSLVVVSLEECLQSVRNDGLGSFFYHDTQEVPVMCIQRKKTKFNVKLSIFFYTM
jgi:hypothetical protein